MRAWYNYGRCTEEIIMAMSNRSNRKNDCFILCTIEDIVPQDHEVRRLERAVNWEFIYPEVKHLYSDFGRPSIDPVILFKMIMINYTFGINSMRRTCKEIEVNLAYRWFLGIGIYEPVPNYSTWSQNYIRRYKDSDIFDVIFKKILEQAIRHGFINTETVFGDSTHMKASANKRKSISEEVALTKKKFEDDLLDEINEVRRHNGQKEFDSLRRTEYDYDEETGEVKERIDTKTVKQSLTDPESGNFHKGEHEECFAYCLQTICEKNGFVLATCTVPGNIHDSISFYGAYEQVCEQFGSSIKNVCLDSGYKTPAIAREIIENGQVPYLPYKRPMTKAGFFRKYEYTYDHDKNEYRCPQGEVLKYTTINRKGYMEYKSDPEKCKNCPMLGKCTNSRNHQKTVTRHVWADYLDQCERIRHTPEWKEIYPQRKETIERVFAMSKENHGLRYTRLRGLKKNQHQALIIFGCHNLKKMAKWLG